MIGIQKTGTGCTSCPRSPRGGGASGTMNLGHHPTGRSEFRRPSQSFRRYPSRGCHIGARKAHAACKSRMHHRPYAARQAAGSNLALHHRGADRGAIRRRRTVIRATGAVHRRHCQIWCCLHRLYPGKDHNHPQGAKQDDLAQLLQHCAEMPWSTLLCKSRIAEPGGANHHRYPAQQESLATSRSKVCAAIFKPSTVVR